MKVLKFPILFLLTCMLIIQSCSKDNELDITTTEQEEILGPNIVTEENSLLKRANISDVSQVSHLSLDCISIEFPFEVVDQNDIVYSVNDLVEFENLVFDTSGIIYIKDFQYPVTAINELGETISISSAEELGQLFASCIPNISWTEDDFPAFLIDNVTSCVTIDYNEFYVNDGEGDDIKIANQEALIEIMADRLVMFVYPFNLIAEDGTTIAIGSTEELFDALASCNGIYQDSFDYENAWGFEEGFEYIGCYQLAFPYSVELTDGSQVSVTNHQELCDLLVQGTIVDYVYPITLIDWDDNEIAVESADQLYDQLESCYDSYAEFDTSYFVLSGFMYSAYDIDGNALCLDFQFPIHLIGLDENGESQTQTVESRIELIQLIETTFDYLSVELPITATRVSNGEVVTIEDAATFIGEFEACVGSIDIIID